VRQFLCPLITMAMASPALADAQVPLDRTDPGLATQQAPYAADEQSKPAPDARPTIEPASSRDDRVAAPSGVVVGAIRVVGGDDIAPAEMMAAISSFVGHQLSTEDLRDLLSTVSGVARSKGYIFAHSTVPAQTLEAGVLRVELDEGHVDDVRLTGKQSPAVKAIVERLKGHAPTKSEVERQLMLAGDLPGVSIGNVRFERDGVKGILIVPVSLDKVAARAWLDNRGTRALGPFRAQLAVDFNGLISNRDQLTVSDLASPAQPRELNVVSARYAYQLNDRGTEFAAFAAYGRTRSGDLWRAYDSNGKSVNAGASIAQPLIRSRKVSLWLNGEFDYFAVDEWFAGQRVRRDRVSTASLSVNGYTPLLGGRLRAGLGVTQGLDILGSTANDDPLASRPDAGGRFTTFGAWANWVGNLTGPFTAKFAVTAQASTKPLLAIEQITVGGPVFGRAYDFSERAGDRGILGSAELQAKLLDRNKGLVRWAQIYGFADGADVGNLRNAYGTGQLYSAGIGARAKLGGALRVGVEAAFPINADRYETGDKTPRISATAEAAF
jgi:hemolysin activation/secretion protein